MQNSWIPVVRGRTPRQARVGLGDLHEEHVSRAGFFGTAAMLYHEAPIKDPVRVEGAAAVAVAPLAKFSCADQTDAAAFPTKILINDEMSVSLSRRTEAQPYLFRNIDEDSLYFIHKGTGSFATEYGPLAYEPGDMVLLPKGVTYRIMPDSPLEAMIVESRAPIRITEHKQVGRHAPFDPTVLTIPEVAQYDWPAQGEWEVRYRHGDDHTSAFFDYLPFDVVGWKGDCFPFKLNVRDVRPITSERIHLAPSSWAIFESDSFMLVGFLPMQIVQDPEAEELPTRHRNVDTEEVILLRSTDGARPDIVGHFPQGVTHGPDETAREALAAARHPGMQRGTNGISVDAYRRLKRTAAFPPAGSKLRPASAD